MHFSDTNTIEHYADSVYTVHELWEEITDEDIDEALESFNQDEDHDEDFMLTLAKGNLTITFPSYFYSDGDMADEITLPVATLERAIKALRGN